MDEINDDVPLLNWASALERATALQDLAERQFVMIAAATVMQRMSNQKFPEAPVDMEYFIDLMSDLFEQKQTIARVIAGEDVRWFPDLRRRNAVEL